MADVTTRDFYRNTLSHITRSGFRFVVGGTYALFHHTGVRRPTKDLDLFAHRDDIGDILAVMSEAGYQTELRHPHWLGKVHDGARFVDVIFSSGNGVAAVDEAFFDYASPGKLFGVDVLFCPVEEMIWSKAFVMERERYDGADVAHLMHACRGQIDWYRLVERFGEHYRVLLSHVVLFGFIYPSHASEIPPEVVLGLTQRLERETHAAMPAAHVCGGTLLSREQYLADIHEWGYADGRLTSGAMNEAEVDDWTRAIAANEH
jgi:hypothetical protein